MKDLLDNNVKLLLEVLSEDKIMRKCSEFSLKSVFKTLNVEVLSRNKKKSEE